MRSPSALQRSPRRALRSCRGLDVVAVQELLHVEDGQLISLRDAQQSTQSRVVLDVLAVVQLVLLDVGVHGLGDLGARQLSALGQTQEGAQLITDLLGLLELRGRARGAVRGLGTGLALALARLLQITAHAALQALQGRQSSAGRIADRHQLLLDGAQLSLPSGLLGNCLGGGGRGGHNGCCRGRGCRRGRSRRRGSLGRTRLLLSRLGWDSLGRGRRGHNGRGRGGRSRRIGLLHDALGSSGLGRSVHRTGSGGIRRRHFTHQTTLLGNLGTRAPNFLP